MKMRRHSRATLVAAGVVLATALGGFSSVRAQSGPATGVCTWGGTPANPTATVTFDPGVTSTPSAGPTAVHAWGPIDCTGGFHGTMSFDGISEPGSSCLAAVFEGPVYGVPGVARLFGPALGNQVEELLYDKQGNVVGSDQPNVKAFGNSAPNSNGLDCNTPEGFRRAPFSSTVELSN